MGAIPQPAQQARWFHPEHDIEDHRQDCLLESGVDGPF